MPEPDRIPNPEPDPNRANDLTPSDFVVIADGPGDNTVRPSRTPERYRPTKEELAELAAALHKQLDFVVIADGPGDTTVRPRDPNVPICWPEGVPMPWKTKQPPPPEPPKPE
jgi:hypothetical protein